MLNKVDNILNSVTMYRLILYYLIFLLAIAFIYTFFGILPFGPIAIISSISILLIVCYVSNKAFERLFNVQTNVESLYITALILALIITPVKSLSELPFLIIAGVLAMASKYILNIKGKHVFNPASIALVITAFTIHGFASWWVGTLVMFPWALVGILIVRKLRHYDLVFYFFITAIFSTFTLYFLRGQFNVIQILKNTFFDTPLLFFSFVMLTEPLTTPPTKFLQALYGAFVGILIVPIHFGAIYTTPEIALSIGNIFSYIVSPKEKLILILKEKNKLTDSIYDFVFKSSQKLNFKAGQYLEWTLGHPHTDSRGNRRYFTVASSPTETDVRIGIKFEPEKSSSYKREMLSMKNGHKIVASQLAGDFTLPKNINQKLVFVAGGIGVTPYRSIIKYLLDTNEKRDIVLIYSERDIKMMVYKDIFSEAAKKMGTKIIYYESEKMGHMTSQFIKKEIPDFKEREFYLSGSHGMVMGFEDVLAQLNLPRKQIKVDYFPGF
jgi:glycine betaine catabolism B